MTTYVHALRSFSPSLRRLLSATSIAAVVFFGILAVLQNLYLLRLGFDAQFIGLSLGIGQLVWATAALPAAFVGRRIGLRNSIVAGYGISGLAIGLYLMVERLPSDLWSVWILAFQSMMMLGVALVTVSIAPYLVAITHEEERKYAFGVFGSLIPAMAFVGSLVAGMLPGLMARVSGTSLDDPVPYRLAIWVAPLLYVPAILILLGADPGKAAVQDAQEASTDRVPLALLATLGAVALLAAIGEGTLRSFFNVYLNAGLGVPPAQIGAVMGVAQLLPIAAALSAPLVMTRLGTGPTMAVGILTMSAILVPMAVFQVLWVAALGFMGALAAIALYGIARDLLGQELVTPRWRTTIAAVLIIGLALGWAIAGMVGGYLIETIGYGALFAFGSVMGVLSATVLVGLLRARRAPEPVIIADTALP